MCVFVCVCVCVCVCWNRGKTSPVSEYGHVPYQIDYDMFFDIQ